GLKKDYRKTTLHTSPGRHDIYFAYLSDLTKIMTASRHLIVTVIPDVDLWIVKMENIRVPRNLVGHMNFPNLGDRDRIDKLHTELSGLMQRLEKQAHVKLEIP